MSKRILSMTDKAKSGTRSSEIDAMLIKNINKKGGISRHRTMKRVGFNLEGQPKELDDSDSEKRKGFDPSLRKTQNSFSLTYAKKKSSRMNKLIDTDLDPQTFQIERQATIKDYSTMKTLKSIQRSNSFSYSPTKKMDELIQNKELIENIQKPHVSMDDTDESFVLTSSESS